MIYDWALILGELDWLHRDQAIGGGAFLLGVILYGAAIIAGWRAVASSGTPKEPAMEATVGTFRGEAE